MDTSDWTWGHRAIRGQTQTGVVTWRRPITFCYLLFFLYQCWKSPAHLAPPSGSHDTLHPARPKTTKLTLFSPLPSLFNSFSRNWISAASLLCMKGRLWWWTLVYLCLRWLGHKTSCEKQVVIWFQAWFRLVAHEHEHKGSIMCRKNTRPSAGGKRGFGAGRRGGRETYHRVGWVPHTAGLNRKPISQ